MSQEKTRDQILQENLATIEASLLNLALHLVKLEQAPQNTEHRRNLFLLLNQFQTESAKFNFRVIAQAATVMSTALDEMVVYNLLHDLALHDFLFETIGQMANITEQMSRNEKIDFDKPQLEEKLRLLLEQQRTANSTPQPASAEISERSLQTRLALLKQLSARVAQNEQQREEKTRFELLPRFQEETNAILQQLRRVLILLENNPGSSDYLEQAIKIVHSLGQKAGLLKLHEIEQVCTALATILSEMQAGIFALTPGLNGVFFGTIETLGQLADLYSKGEQPSPDVTKLMELLGQFHNQELTHKVLAAAILDSNYTTSLGLNLYPELTKSLHLLARRIGISHITLTYTGGELALSPAKIDKLHKAVFGIVLNLVENSGPLEPDSKKILECSFAAHLENEKVRLEISSNLRLNFELIRQQATSKNLLTEATAKTTSNTELFELMLTSNYQAEIAQPDYKHPFNEIREAGVGLHFKEQTEQQLRLELEVTFQV